MESKRQLTRQFLEQCGITDIQSDYFVMENRQLKWSNQEKTIIVPTIAKCKNSMGELQYLSLCVAPWDPISNRNISVQYHRMVWAWHYGEVPIGYEIDHINTNPFDNRIENLRLTTRTENFANKKKWKMFTLEEIEGKTIPEIRQMIFDRIEEYKDCPYKKPRNNNTEKIKARHERILLNRAEKKAQSEENKKQKKLEILYGYMKWVENDSTISAKIKENRLKKIEIIIENVKKTGKYGKGYNYLKGLKENAKES